METDIEKKYGDELTDTLKRISSHPGVMGLIITKTDRDSIYSTMDTNQTYILSSKLSFFREMANYVVKIMDPEDELMVIRIKTSKYEIMEKLATADNTIVVLQQNINLDQ